MAQSGWQGQKKEWWEYNTWTMPCFLMSCRVRSRQTAIGGESEGDGGLMGLTGPCRSFGRRAGTYNDDDGTDEDPHGQQEQRVHPGAGEGQVR